MRGRAKCGLTCRSTGPPTAAVHARAAPRYMLLRAGMAVCLRGPVNSTLGLRKRTNAWQPSLNSTIPRSRTRFNLVSYFTLTLIAFFRKERHTQSMQQRVFRVSTSSFAYQSNRE